MKIVFLLFANALFLAAPVAECVPVRWPSADPASLELLAQSPLNCLLLEEPEWQREFVAAARGRKLRLLGVVRDGRAASAEKAVAAGLDGVVAEGASSEELRGWAGKSGKPLVELLPRSSLSLTLKDPPAVVGTAQGLWPGVRAEKEGQLQARPTSGPWIETNSGFLRYLRVVVPPVTAIWMANRPPAGAFRAEIYVRAIADAAMCGARWVLAMDGPFWEALVKGDSKAVAGWARIQRALQFYEEQRTLCLLPDWSGLALVEDESNGALISGGIVDMIAAKHIPLSIMLPSRLTPAAEAGVKMLLTIDPAALTAAQKETARNLARRGATLVNGPPGWKMELPGPGQITFSDQQVKQLDEIWREINSLIGRRNFAVRIFGAPGMLSTLKADAGQQRLALHLVNFTDYPVESVTLHFTSKLKSARLVTPRGMQALEVYDTEDGSGVDLARVEDAAIVVLETAAENQPKG